MSWQSGWGIPRRNFYYLDSPLTNPAHHVNWRLLKEDIARGVTRLPEYVYVPGWGSTTASLRFLNALRRFLDVTKAHRAVLTYSSRHHFTLSVYLKDGPELVFKGVSGGYFGEGTRGCHDILRACGFNDKQCKKPFTLETFTVMKRI